MKVIFYLPAHPSYFDDEYTQEEIESVLKMFQVLSPPYKIGIGEIPVEFVFLREPNKSVMNGNFMLLIAISKGFFFFMRGNYYLLIISFLLIEYHQTL